MYDYIKGTLVKITAKHIVIETNGLGLSLWLIPTAFLIK